MAEIKLKNLKKVYSSGAVGLSGVDLSIADGEFTVVLGESGSGKTALSRVICGLDDVTEGEIIIDNVVVNDLQPKDRDLALVVKSVGLMPTLNVFDNLSYGLKLRKMPKEEIEERTYEVARILGLTNVLSKNPKNVTSIERQRVCIGRAFARRPKLIILDDPFSDFNAETRLALCEDVYKLQKRSKINFIYFTKKPQEALALADKIIVLENGKVINYDTPINVYDRPGTLRAARFIGEPPVNVFSGKIKDENGLKFVAESFECSVSEDRKEALKDYINSDKKIQLAVRAEDVYYGDTFKGKIEETEKCGENEFVAFTVAGDSSAHYFKAEKSETVGEERGFALDIDKANFYDFDTEKIIL